MDIPLPTRPVRADDGGQERQPGGQEQRAHRRGGLAQQAGQPLADDRQADQH